MKKNKKEILKSPEIQEIIGFVPHWLVRWGSLTIFFFILTLLGIACLIRYPDTIAGQIILTTDNPPVRVVNTMEGKIIKLLIPDDAQVEKGNIIATLESSLSEDAINILKKIISNANNLSEQDITVEGITFGSIQGEINLLKATIAGYHAKEERKVAAERIHNLESQIVNYRNLLAIKTEQNKIAHLELEDATSRLEIQQNLFETGVISRLSFFEEKELFSSKQKEISDLQSTLIQVNIEINNQSKALF